MRLRSNNLLNKLLMMFLSECGNTIRFINILGFLITIVVVLPIFTACSKDETDTEKPKISLDVAGAFPVNCDTLYFGETNRIILLFTDNGELGAYSIDVHQNFDHHSHSTEMSQCELDPKKDAINPFVFIQDYPIPAGLKEYRVELDIAIPDGNTTGPFDEGDYHILFNLTDREGWSAIMGLNIKMLRR